MQLKSIMLQGTGSHVGKSVLTAALCRIFYQEGYKVAPFKSQNMALNSYVTKDGGEMGRAQVVQAEAAGIEPHVDMNPILLKPTGQNSSQVIVLGKPIGNISAREYHNQWTKQAMDIIMASWDRLCKQYNLIVIEGAGSPVEINLKSTEVVNMRIAKATNSPVIIVADIDKGGVLASLVGTMELLDPEERDLVAGFIINKFRGDVSLFQPAVEFLEEKTGKPVLGIIPYFQGFKVQEEDSQIELTKPTFGSGSTEQKIEIAVILIPHISNFTDFDALGDEPDVSLRYIGKGQNLGHPDLLILPGSKNTIEDLLYIQNSGLADEIRNLYQQGTPIIGICGGFQMLGKELFDPLHTESALPSLHGLGLLDMITTFEPEKVTCQVKAEPLGRGQLIEGLPPYLLTGYEIHMGRCELGDTAKAAFTITERSGRPETFADGAVSADGLVLGTYLHGIFDNDFFRRHMINRLRKNKGLEEMNTASGLKITEQREEDLNKLSELVRTNLDMAAIRKIIGL